MRFRRVECIGEGKTGFEVEKFENNWIISQVLKDNEVQKRIPAMVPGNVQLDLIRANIIPDPFIAQNNEQCKWIPKVEWDYDNDLQLDPWITKIKNTYENGGLLHIVFDAIDYDASFFIENKKITRQTGMFSPVDIVC